MTAYYNEHDPYAAAWLRELIATRLIADGIVGSCPCQPFSIAGQKRGTKDPRHLWPHFRRLIRAYFETLTP